MEEEPAVNLAAAAAVAAAAVAASRSQEDEELQRSGAASAAARLDQPRPSVDYDVQQDIRLGLEKFKTLNCVIYYSL